MNRLPPIVRAELSLIALLALWCSLLLFPVQADVELPPAPNPGIPVTYLAAQAVPEDQEDFENQRIEEALLSRATVIEDYIIENCTVTHYCICQKCCGKEPSDPAYGITRSGLTATPGVSVAVDPSVIPLGSDVLADYGDGIIHYYRADDTGSAINGSHIDLCVSSHQEALQAGVTTATVYYVPQEDAK